MLKKIWIIVFLPVTLCLSAQQPARIWFSVDEEGKTEDLLDLEKAHFEPLHSRSLNLGFFDGQVLLKIIPPKDKAFIEFQNPNLDEVYMYQNGELIFATGDYYPFKQKPVASKYFRFPVTDYTHPVYFRLVHHGDQFFLPVRFLSAAEAETFDFIDQFINGIYYGIIIIILLLNIFMFFGAGEKPNMYYVLYLIGLGLLQFALSGYAYRFLWTDSPYWANHSLPFLATFSVFFLVLFVQHFLSVKQYLPKWNGLLNITAFLLVVNAVLSLYPNAVTYRMSILVINVLTLVLNVLILPLSVILYKKYKVKGAKFFILAFSFLIVAVFIFVLRNLGVLPSNFFTNNVLLAGSVLEVSLLTFAIVDKFREFKEEALHRLEKINRLQSEQNIILEQKVAERTRALSEKNQEITDSLQYAKRIQQALIPSEQYVQQFFTDSFVLFQPKDIVSGDFYWISPVTTSKGQKMIVFTVADCTGHGVPGAIISVIGLKILNQSLKQPQINSPAEALDFLNEEVSATLNSNSDTEDTIKDGMDIALCAFDPEEKILHFAGAKNPVYIIKNNELIVLKPDRNAIGYNDQNSPYTNKSIALETGDTVYLFSDGYADQFGGEKGKKLKYKPFKNLLLSIQHLSMMEQKQYLQQFFNQWKGNLEQVDDVCIVGVKI